MDRNIDVDKLLPLIIEQLNAHNTNTNKRVPLVDLVGDIYIAVELIVHALEQMRWDGAEHGR